MSTLKVGDQAPAIQANDQNGEAVDLATYRGKKVILFFYPKDNTPGCTAEACNFRDNYQDLLDKGFAVIGVSCDSAKKHQNFIAKYDLPFPLVADTEQVVVNDYGVWGLKKFMGREYMGINRMTYIIDEQGVIEHIITKVKTKASTEQVLEVLGA